jgi:uncharacterized protein (TIGR03437 family)
LPIDDKHSYNKGQPVDGNFTITGNHEVKFRVRSYDHNRELVIDPMLLYSSYIGGSALSQVNAMAVNAAGDIYLVGSTEATNYPTTPGVIQPTCPLGNPQNGFPAGLPKCGQGESGTPAAFVSKISADGKTLIYSTYLGGGGDGSGLEYGTGIAVDSGDNAWVVGQTSSNDFPITADAYLPYCAPAEIYSGINVISPEGSSCGGNANSLFLVQLNPTGKTELYGTFLGDTNGVLGAQIVLDAAGDIYIAGSAYTNTVGTFAQTGAYTFPTTPSAYQPLPIGGSSYSAFVSEFAPGGKSLIYSTIFGGPYQNTYNGALAVNAGKIFIGGYTQDPDLPTTPGALSHTCVGGPTAKGPDTVCINGSQNAYVAEFDPTKSGAASLVFSTYLNGSVSTQGTEMSTVNALAADAKGNVYAGGQVTYTNKEHFPSTAGVVQPTCFVATNSGQCGTGFVTKLSPSGSLVWSTFYGDTSQTGGEGVNTIALDSSDDVYIAGNTQGEGEYLLNNPFQTFMGGEAYVTELSSDATQVLFGSFYGGGANVFPTGMVVDAAGNIYLAGYTNADLPLVKAYQSNNYGGGFPEGFFAKISLSPAAGAPAPNLVLSASAFGGFPAVAPGSWIEVYGMNLAPKIDGWAKDFNGNNAPTVVDGVSVKIGGVAAFVDYISPTQVNAQLPSNIPTGGMLPLTLTNGAQTSLAYNIMVNATEPGLLAASAFKIGGKQYVVAQHLDGSYVLPKGAIAGVTSSPALVGETIVIYGVGFGSVTPNIPAGEIATEGSRLSAPFTMQFGKTRADVTYLGLSPDSVGVYQFNVVVPAEGTSDLVPLTFTLGGVAGTQTLYTAVEQ